MKRKVVLFLFAVFAVASIAAGCGNSDKGTEKETVAESSTIQMEEQPDTEETGRLINETEKKAEIETSAESEIFQEFLMYTLDDVYIRESMDTEAKVVTVADRGSEIIVTGEEGDWYKIRLNGKEGYMRKKFLTESKEEAEGAVKAEEAAQEAARRAAEAQAGQPSGDAKYEVSRQKFDDCDGSGHGYAIVTYSDGSTETVEY